MCSAVCLVEKSSESACGGSGEPVLESEPPQIGDENSCSSHFSISDCLRAPEEPDLADRSSQSSLNSQDDAGTCSDTHEHTHSTTPFPNKLGHREMSLKDECDDFASHVNSYLT